MSSSSKWFYTDNGKDKPRVTMPELLELYNAGSITEKTYVWHKSYCQKWTPINEVSMIMQHIETMNGNPNRTQPSIIRNKSNNTSSEMQEIAVNESFAAISESEEDTENTEKKVITSIAPHIIDETAHLSNTKKVQGYRKSISNSFNHSSNSISYYSSSNNNINANDENYKISQLVEINDAHKFRGTVYGLVADIDRRHKKMVIKYNNKAYGTEWFDVEDDRVSIVTDPAKKQQHGSGLHTRNGDGDNLSSEDESKTDKVNSRVVLPSNSNNYVYSKSKKKTHARHKSHRVHKATTMGGKPARNRQRTTKSYSVLHSANDLLLIKRKSTILNTVNMNEEKLSLLSERKLLNLERDELQREQEKLFYSKKKHETEIWAVKNDYIEQTKKLKKQYNVYKVTCQGIMCNTNNSEETNHLLLKYHKLETKGKLIKDSQKSADKKQKTAQILYQTSTQLLQKVQDATLKMEVYAKLCDEKCDTERELIKKQEIDRKKYLNKLNRLRDEMISAPWLLLSSTNNTNTHTKSELDRLRTKLGKTYQAIREERRKFLPVQRKWAKLIMKHQIYAQDEKAFMNVRTKLENIRNYEKEYKLKIFEEIKSICDCNKLEEHALQIKEEEIMLSYKSQLVQDKQRQIRNEKKLLRLQQRNLEDSITELEYERELISAQKSTLHSAINKDKLDDISSQMSMDGVGMDRAYTHQHDMQLKHELDAKSEECNEMNHRLQEALHKNDKLQMKLTHFEESMEKENNDKEKKEQNYEKFTKAMEGLTAQFEEMMRTKDEEIRKMENMVQTWKDKAAQTEKHSIGLNLEMKNMQQTMRELKNENKDLMAQNQQLEYTLPQLRVENEHLTEQIQEMIISSDEALKQHEKIKIRKEEEEEEEEERLKTPKIVVSTKGIKTKKRKSSKTPKPMNEDKDTHHLLAIDDETENILSDVSNYEETAAALSSIRSKLADSDETGRLITKHESQHSMTAIVDLVKKAKENMESQRVDLEILADRASSGDDSDLNRLLFTQSADDSYSDHLFTIENILNGSGDRDKKKKKKNNEIHLMHSDIDTDTVDTGNEDTNRLNVYLSTPDSDCDDSNDSNDSTNDSSNVSSDEPPMFWNHNDDDIQSERCILQRLRSDPNGVLNDVMSPSARMCSYDDDNLSSDWDKCGSNDSNDDCTLKITKKSKKKKKSKHKKGRKSVDKKYGKTKKKRSRKSLKTDHSI